MTLFYRIFRSIVVTMIMLVIVVPLVVYVLLTLTPVQNSLKSTTEQELSRLLDSHVTIKSLGISPFNRVVLREIAVTDNKSDTLMKVHRLGAGINLSSLMRGNRIVVDYAELTEIDLRLKRDSANAPLNIDHVIRALSKKDDKKKPKPFDIAVNTVVIRKTSVKYDVLSEPACEGKFDKNHISVSDFRADISLPKLKNNDFTIDINRIAAVEKSGLAINDFHGRFTISADSIAWESMALSLPRTSLEFENTRLALTDGLGSIKESLGENTLNIGIKEGSHINPADLAPLCPALSAIDTDVALRMNVNGNLKHAEVNGLEISAPERHVILMMSGNVKNATSPDSLEIDFPLLSLKASGNDIAAVMSEITKLTPKAESIIRNTGLLTFNGHVKGNMRNADIMAKVVTNPGSFDISGHARRHTLKSPFTVNAEISTNQFNLGALLDNPHFSTMSLLAKANGTLNGINSKGTFETILTDAEINGYRYADAIVSGGIEDGKINASFNLSDPLAAVSINVKGDISEDTPEFQATAHFADVNFHGINLIKRYEGYKLGATVTANVRGKNPDLASGFVKISNLDFKSETGDPLIMKEMLLTIESDSLPAEIRLRSDFVDADIRGSYSFKTIMPDIKEILAQSFPVFFENDSYPRIASTDRINDFTLHTEIKYDEGLNRFLRLPVNIIYPINIDGAVDHASESMRLSIDAPYLQNKDKLIEGTSLKFSTDSLSRTATLAATTKTPTANGLMTINIGCDGSQNRMDSDIAWVIDRKRTYKGNINLSTLFAKDNENNPIIDLSINPSDLVFNDTTWHINPSNILASNKYLEVNGFDVRHDNQYVTMNGSVNSEDTDSITLDLKNVNLDYIFESLGIDKAMLGGDATGTFYISQIFSPEPRMLTDRLFVKNISYNKVVFGDAVIKSHWDNETRGITLDAVIDQPNGLTSKINGAIYPMNESLDLTFNAQKINVAFLKPYMSAFTSDVSGLASGRAHLFGTFKYIDLEGEVYAEDLKLKLDFTNTVYSCTDSVIMTPGKINLKNITLYDVNGKTALLNGTVTHKFFKEPSFDFSITRAYDFLSYNTNSNMNPDWYGTIYGSGSVFVKGEPGTVDITVDMTTAPKSVFTFVLNDREDANEYSFITFRDRDKLLMKDSTDYLDPTPLLVRRLKERMKHNEEDNPSVYKMDLQIGVTPEATLYLVMDPVGGDRIKANGAGNLRMTYESADEDLRMYGKYTLDRGDYNFTLQDIIIKDFSIKPGSQISFQGDPYAAQLNISAIYQVNANLSDLDESFLQDKDLNRTNVPVHALLLVSGDIRQPEINFDLEFPTLTSDTYRKVKSIVSTEDMMNRQIIYLLALNRFYTPDYMGATTKGNELVSVASSTISSQLSNMLGQLSDNWSIAPNFRSDRGDFSDMEVDLALSSNLLNNRLLFNGNFGYRDKTLNTNQFIGDFDLEYLLNQSGTVRLKAYNRYNDQNYYVKTATTTQGVGVVLKRDFDNIFSFLKPISRYLRQRKNKTQPNLITIPKTEPEKKPADNAAPTDSEDFIKLTPKKENGNN